MGLLPQVMGFPISLTKKCLKWDTLGSSSRVGTIIKKKISHLKFKFNSIHLLTKREVSQKFKTGEHSAEEAKVRWV